MDLEEYRLLGCEPIPGEEPAGLVDISEYDAYNELRAHVDNVGNSMESGETDWDAVENLAKGLLQSVSKNVVVAGFLAVALVQNGGSVGHARAGVLLASLGRTFGGALRPKRVRACVNAMEWMAETLKEHAEQLRCSRADTEILQEAADRAQEAFDALRSGWSETEISTDDLKPLGAWAKSLQAKRAQAERSQQAAEEHKRQEEITAKAGPATPTIPDTPESALSAISRALEVLDAIAPLSAGFDAAGPLAY